MSVFTYEMNTIYYIYISCTYRIFHFYVLKSDSTNSIVSRVEVMNSVVGFFKTGTFSIKEE